MQANSPWAYMPSQTALILADFHTVFLPRLPAVEAQACIAAAAKARQWALAHGVHVIHCLVDIDDEIPPTCLRAERLKGMLNNMRADGGANAIEAPELSEEVDAAVSKGKEVTFKRQPGLLSVLTSAGLLEFLQKEHVRSLVVCGISTSACVLRSVFAAADQGFVVSILKNAIADPDPEFGNMVLEKLISAQATVLDTEQLLQQMFV